MTSDVAPRARGILPLLLLAALIGLVLRLAFSLGYWNDKPLTRDEHEYLSLARSLAAGDGFVYDEILQSGSFMPFGRAPGYPAFLALVGGGRTPVDHVPGAVKVAQSVVGAFGVLAVGLVAGRLAGRRAGQAAALVAAVHPPLVWIAAYALSEALFWPMGLALVWLIDRAHADRTRGFRWALAAGLAAGAGILVRPGLLLVLPFIALWWVWQRRYASVAAVLAGVLLVVLPWTVRNYQHHGKLVIVASDGGVTFWTGNHPLAIGEGDMAANPAIKLDNQALRARHPGLNEEEMEPIYYREALAWIRTNPLDWLGLQVRKIFYTIVPVGPSYMVHSRLYIAGSVIPYALLLPVAIAGAWRLGRRLGATPGLVCLIGSAIATCLVFFPQERFRIPVIDPALIIVASAVVGDRRERS